MKYQTIIVNSEGEYSLKNGMLKCQNSEGEKLIYFTDLHTIIFNVRQQVSTNLLIKLIQNQVNIVFCDEKYMPVASLCLFSKNGNLRDNITLQYEYQSYDALWKKIVKNKLKNQLWVLEYVTNNDSDLEYFATQINLVKNGDETNREAVLAKSFFRIMYGEDYNRFDFDLINSFQNYGYKLLVSQVSNALSCYGLIQIKGIFHKSKLNEYNLAYDLVEVFRPLVDFVTLYLVKKYDNLNVESKQELMEYLDTYVKYNNKKYLLKDAINEMIINYIKILKNESDWVEITLIDPFEQ